MVQLRVGLTRALQLEGVALLEGRCAVHSEDGAMFRHLPPPLLIPDITFSDLEQASL